MDGHVSGRNHLGIFYAETEDADGAPVERKGTSAPVAEAEFDAAMAIFLAKLN